MMTPGVHVGQMGNCGALGCGDSCSGEGRLGASAYPDPAA